MNSKKSLSIRIALISSIAAIAALVALCVAIPFLSRFYLEDVSLSKEQYDLRFTVIMIFSYIGVLPVFASNIMLIKLLRLVMCSEIFTQSAVKLLHKISLCCIIELLPVAALFLPMGRYGIIMIILAFLGIFLSAVLSVVKNVIARATEIKAENDFTV